MLVSDSLTSIVSDLQREGHLPPSVEMSLLRSEKKRTRAAAALLFERKKQQREQEKEKEMLMLSQLRRPFNSSSPGPSSYEEGGESSSVGYQQSESVGGSLNAVSAVDKNGLIACDNCGAVSQSNKTNTNPTKPSASTVPLLLRLSSSAEALSQYANLSSSTSPRRSNHSSSKPAVFKPSGGCGCVSSSYSGGGRSSSSRVASPIKWKQFSAKAVDDRQTRLLKLTKRHCLSSAACVLLRSWTSMNPHGQYNELRSTPDQLHEGLEKFVLKLLAAAGVVTPYAFTCALRYLQQLSWNACMNIHPQSLHMVTLAAVLIACKCNGEDKCYKNLVAQFAKLCLCSTEELAKAERVLFQLLLDADISLIPSTEELLNFMQNTLLPQSIPCSHDITSGRHCWVGLFPVSIQPYPVGAPDQVPMSLGEMCKIMPATRGSTGRVSALFAPFATSPLAGEALADRERSEKKNKLPSPGSIVKKSDVQKKSQDLSGFDDDANDDPTADRTAAGFQQHQQLCSGGDDNNSSVHTERLDLEERVEVEQDNDV